MTTFTGHAPVEFLGVPDLLRNPDAQAIATVVTVGQVWDQEPQACGSLTNTQPIARYSAPRTGFLLISWMDDLYNTIWITPNPLDVGTVLVETVAQFRVWNAYFVAQMLLSIDPVNNDGLTLEDPDPPPATYGALEEREYDLTAGIIGPGQINATYSFAFVTETAILVVIGSRAVLFAYPANTAEDVQETYEWLTEMLVAYDGSKQFRGLRGSPRWETQFSILIDKSAKQDFENRLFANQPYQWGIPLWMDVCHLSVAASIGETTFQIGDLLGQFTIGGNILLRHPLGAVETLAIASMDVASITTTSPTQANWPLGTRIYPIRFARLRDLQRTDHLTSKVLRARVEFESGGPIALTELESTTLYRGEPVYLTGWNWISDMTREYRRKVELIDNLLNQSTIKDESGLPYQLLSGEITFTNRAARLEFLKWLQARLGRYNGFWMPTHSQDFTIVTDISPTDSWIEIQRCGYTQFVKAAVGRRDLAILDSLGVWHFHRISNYEILSETVERISILPDVFGVGLTAGQIRKACYLIYGHLASDRQTIEHETDQWSRCQLVFESDIDPDV